MRQSDPQRAKVTSLANGWLQIADCGFTRIGFDARGRNRRGDRQTARCDDYEQTNARLSSCAFWRSHDALSLY